MLVGANEAGQLGQGPGFSSSVGSIWGHLKLASPPPAGRPAGQGDLDIGDPNCYISIFFKIKIKKNGKI